MRGQLLINVMILGSVLVWTPAPAFAEVPEHTVQHRSVHRRPVYRRGRNRRYIRHRTKMQHAKIIGGTALRGASVGGLIGGPPGSAVGAAAGAAVGTAYDLKTRKVKASHK